MKPLGGERVMLLLGGRWLQLLLLLPSGGALSGSESNGHQENFVQIETKSGSDGRCNKEVSRTEALEVGRVGKNS